MKISESLNLSSNEKTVVTIGTFDGVHIGHQKIVAHLIKTAKIEGLKSAVLTFFPHPRMVLQKDANIKLINTVEERYHILESLGIDYLFIKEFTHEFSRMSAEDFVKEILLDKLHAKKIIIGYDHRFGRNRNADIEDLKKFGEKYHFEVEEIAAQDIDAVSVSSTKIRKALKEGNIKKSNAYLGYNFMITGTVIKGRGLGREIGYPTANIKLQEQYKLIPKQGSYIVTSEIDGNRVFGMMNIGTNPTVEGKEQSIEVHFFNFDASIYGNKIKIELLERLREEKKFESLDQLKHQLDRDKFTALQFISKYNAE